MIATRSDKRRNMPSGTKRIRGALEKATMGDSKPILRQIAQMLKSGIAFERMGARKILLDIVLNGGSDQARKILLGDSRTALVNVEPEERLLVRDALRRLIDKKSCKEAEEILEADDKSCRL